eukprot:m.22400 g.22400  ORF g.22400 m.22400 type:complete len:50 (+) comp13804_c1_seq1:1005-1154(+)
MHNRQRDAIAFLYLEYSYQNLCLLRNTLLLIFWFSNIITHVQSAITLFQ